MTKTIKGLVANLGGWTVLFFFPHMVPLQEDTRTKTRKTWCFPDTTAIGTPEERIVGVGGNETETGAVDVLSSSSAVSSGSTDQRVIFFFFFFFLDHFSSNFCLMFFLSTTDFFFPPLVVTLIHQCPCVFFAASGKGGFVSGLAMMLFFVPPIFCS